ncbi:MAG: hypothetical protein QG670_464 [Thermoproteota archaeon]|nr:hypothetical protein [Thermoproteota archaeon]
MKVTRDLKIIALLISVIIVVSGLVLFLLLAESRLLKYGPPNVNLIGQNFDLNDLWNYKFTLAWVTDT